MSISPEATLAREATNWKAVVIGGALAIAGIVLAGFSGQLSTGWRKDAWLALTTTLISTGALAVLFELALRRSVYREMLRLVGIRDGVASQQLIGGSRATALNWDLYLQGRSQFQALLLDPLPWVDAQMHRVLDNSRHRRSSFSFILPDPNAAYLGDLATALGIDAPTLEATIKSAVQRLENHWTALVNQGGVVAGSVLEIRLLDRRPLYSLLLCDDLSIVIFGGVTGRRGADTDYAYIHSGTRDSFPSSWFGRQLSEFGTLPIRFEMRT